MQLTGFVNDTIINVGQGLAPATKPPTACATCILRGDKMELPKRKSIRLKNYDYTSNGAYFVTICTHNRECLLGDVIVGEGFHALPCMKLSQIGMEIDKTIQFTHEKYGCIDKYIIMPNHIHIVIIFHKADRHGSLSLQNVVGRMKSFTTLKYNQMNCVKDCKLWQRSYYDHIIRNDQEYQEI